MQRRTPLQSLTVLTIVAVLPTQADTTPIPSRKMLF